jgi:hypothetical protein
MKWLSSLIFVSVDVFLAADHTSFLVVFFKISHDCPTITRPTKSPQSTLWRSQNPSSFPSHHKNDPHYPTQKISNPFVTITANIPKSRDNLLPCYPSSPKFQKSPKETTRLTSKMGLGWLIGAGEEQTPIPNTVRWERSHSCWIPNVYKIQAKYCHTLPKVSKPHNSHLPLQK